MKYHVNAKGEAAICHASVKPCPLGGEHYASLDEAEFAAELSELLGERISPSPVAAEAQSMLDVSAESRRAIELIESTTESHQFIHALVNAEKPEVRGALSQLGIERLDERQKFEAFKLLSENYFDLYGSKLSALPPADVFSTGHVPGSQSPEEHYAMARKTLDSSVGVLARVRLLTHPEDPKNAEERAYLAAQGEMTTEMAVAKISELSEGFYASMRESIAFVLMTQD